MSQTQAAIANQVLAKLKSTPFPAEHLSENFADTTYIAVSAASPYTLGITFDDYVRLLSNCNAIKGFHNGTPFTFFDVQIAISAISRMSFDTYRQVKTYVSTVNSLRYYIAATDEVAKLVETFNQLAIPLAEEIHNKMQARQTIAFPVKSPFKA